MKRLTHYFLVVIAIACGIFRSANAADRTWTRSNGKTIEASYRGQEDGDVLFCQKRTFKSVVIPVDELSEKDQEFLKSLKKVEDRFVGRWSGKNEVDVAKAKKFIESGGGYKNEVSVDELEAEIKELAATAFVYEFAKDNKLTEFTTTLKQGQRKSEQTWFVSDLVWGKVEITMEEHGTKGEVKVVSVTRADVSFIDDDRIRFETDHTRHFPIKPLLLVREKEEEQKE